MIYDLIVQKRQSYRTKVSTWNQLFLQTDDNDDNGNINKDNNNNNDNDDNKDQWHNTTAAYFLSY